MIRISPRSRRSSIIVGHRRSAATINAMPLKDGLPMTKSFRIAPIDLPSCGKPLLLSDTDALGDDEREAFNTLIDSWFDDVPESPHDLSLPAPIRAVTPSKELVAETKEASRKRPSRHSQTSAQGSAAPAACPWLGPNCAHHRCPSRALTGDRHRRVTARQDPAQCALQPPEHQHQLAVRQCRQPPRRLL